MHVTLLIWSGKLFQSEGAKTEKVQFPQESGLSSETTNNSLLHGGMECPRCIINYGVCINNFSHRECFSSLPFFSFYNGLGHFTGHLRGQSLPQEKSLGKLVVRLIVAG